MRTLDELPRTFGSEAPRMGDVDLEYWGDAFAGSGLGGRMTFEQFLDKTPLQREMAIGAEQVQERLEAQLRRTDHCCETRGGQLIEPMRHPSSRHSKCQDRPVSIRPRRALK